MKSIKTLHGCPGNAVGTDDMLTDYMYHEYNTPMFTPKISCCQYPAVENIPYIWREILQPTMDLLKIIKTGNSHFTIILLHNATHRFSGVQGYIKDENSNPMRNATVNVQGISKTYEGTKQKGHFKILLPEGSYILDIHCHTYKSRQININLKQDEIFALDIILQKKNESESEELTTESNNNEGTGIKGYIRDNMNHPVSNAEVHIVETNFTTFSNKDGRYLIHLNSGKYTVVVSNSGYTDHIKYVEVTNVNPLPKFVMFTLTKDTTVMGLPRLVFIIFTGA